MRIFHLILKCCSLLLSCQMCLLSSVSFLCVSLLNDTWWSLNPSLNCTIRSLEYETFFNSVLSSNRQTEERSIRLLKGRWQKLQHLDHLNQKLIVLLIIGACVLHNICLLHDDFDEGYMLDNENDDNDGGDDNGVAGRNDRLAQQKRNNLKAVIYANRI